MRWHPGVAHDIPGAFARVFGHTVSLKGTVYFAAPPHEVQAHIDRLAASRDMPATRASGKPWSYFQAVSPGSRARIEGHEDNLVQRGFGERSQCLVNVTQNAHHHNTCSEHVPALLRGSLIYSPYHRRCLIPAECLQLMGFPIFEECASAKPCFARAALEQTSFSDSQMRAMAGNAMHCAAVGACIMFLLGFTRPVELQES